MMDILRVHNEKIYHQIFGNRWFNWLQEESLELFG
jgi:uncharacterized ferritin-like protein (DUF455 family)